MQRTTQTICTPDGIQWHVERFFPSPPSTATIQAPDPNPIVLIPSGEGDCHNLTTLAEILSTDHNHEVITFDNPGFSRTSAPLQAYDCITPQLMAGQISTLLSELQIPRASFFGCSSGGLTVIALAALHSEHVKCGIIHEVPFTCPPPFLLWKELSDAEIVRTCATFFAEQFTEDKGRWDAMGREYHERLAENYVTWVRHLVGIGEDEGKKIATPENLRRRPIFWTVGGLNEGVESEGGMWAENFEVARRAGLVVERERLKCLHFPAVSVPEDTARWIDDCVRKAER